ncbi:hypothetical protein GS634_21915 [Ruegeria atlantica]|uniref:DUF3618 domain-containing protein n=1 Tax=Ruegeria atlantica TaxID=81569 RepID=A0AA90Z5W2_9RHOB|nr:hypothetical protein [Ruegeria atlantica]NOE20796.1 hypothetical protein [Ruegeria atlantica]
MTELTELENHVAYERNALATSLDSLTETLAPDRLAQTAKDVVEGYGGEIGTQIWIAARKNPAAFTLFGAGLALLMAGPGAPARTMQNNPRTKATQNMSEEFDRRVEAADVQIKKEMTGMMEQDFSASHLSAALDRGLEKLSPKAHSRVLQARKAAIEAQRAVEKRAKQTTKASKSFLHEQPIAAGALALGVGVLVGALLPNTRKEDELLGARRDELMRKAQNTLTEEMGKLYAAANEKLDDVAASASASLRN